MVVSAAESLKAMMNGIQRGRCYSPLSSLFTSAFSYSLSSSLCLNPELLAVLNPKFPTKYSIIAVEDVRSVKTQDGMLKRVVPYRMICIDHRTLSMIHTGDCGMIRKTESVFGFSGSSGSPTRFDIVHVASVLSTWPTPLPSK